jgi:hypothetical protein
MLDAIVEAKAIAAADGRPLEILGYVLGTDLDTPSLEKQCQMLTDAGVIWPAAAPTPDCWRVNLSVKGEA